MKKLIWLLLLIIIGCGKKEAGSERASEVKPVKTIELKRERIVKEVVGNSDILPMNKTTQITKSGGEVVEINNLNGDLVNRGDLVVKLYNEEVISRYERARADYHNKEAQMNRIKKFSERELRRDLEEARAAYIQSKGNLSAAEKRWREGEINYERNKELYDEGLISELEFLRLESAYEEARVNYDSLREGGVDEKREKYELVKYRVAEREWEYDIRAAEASYELAKAEYSAAKKDYTDLEVRARIDGRVADMDLDLYEEIDENIHLFNLLDTRTVRVETTVSGADISYISLGDRVEVWVEDIGRTYEGSIYEINPQADTSTRRFPIKVAIENPEEELKSGMYARVSMGSVERETLVVPKEAVMIRELVEYVAVVEDDLARILGVKTGITGRGLIEIRSDELKEGMRIVVRGQYLLADGDSVREVE